MNEIIDNYKVYPEKQFILQRLLGVVNMENLIKVKQEQDKDPTFDLSFKLLTDVREADVQFTAKEIQSYIEYIKSEFDESKGNRIALVTATPIAVVIGTMVQSKTPDLEHELEVFSTIPAALNWLGVHVPKEELLEFFDGKIH